MDDSLINFGVGAGLGRSGFDDTSIATLAILMAVALRGGVIARMRL